MYKRQFYTFEQQINHLKSKGLIIPDKEYAKAMLKQIGYFPLIDGYKQLFRKMCIRDRPSTLAATLGKFFLFLFISLIPFLNQM